MSCQADYCKYSIKCQCNKNYIGETTNLRLKFNLHKLNVREGSEYNVREGSEYEVSKYIKGCGGNFKIMPVYKMNSDDKRRRSMESKLIKSYNPELIRRV